MLRPGEVEGGIRKGQRGQVGTLVTQAGADARAFREPGRHLDEGRG